MTPADGRSRRERRLDRAALRQAVLRRVLRWVTLIVLAFGVLVVGGLALAYWTGSGAGSASGSVGTFAAPSSVTATVSAGSATVSTAWVATSGPGGAAIDGYYVRRFSGSTPSPACGTSPSSLLSATVTTCDDTNVSSGTYTYSVTAVFRSWTATSAASAAVAVNPIASFTVTAPASVTAGTPFSVTVTAKNAANATITGYVGSVHFTSSDPGSPVLPADYVFVAGDNGAHTFTNGVTLTTAPSRTVTVNDVVYPSKTGTATVTVTAAAAAKLGFTQQPGGGTSAVAWATQAIVAIQDQFGNTVSSVASVTLAITPGTGTSGAVLTCTTNPKAAVAGLVTFAGCKVDKSGTGYSLTATATGLTSTVSGTFTIVAGAATKVGYTQQPTNVVAGSPISPAVVATIQDASGNTVTSSTATVNVAITTNPGGGTLSGTVSKAAASGVATFADLSINKSGTGYKLTLTSTGLTSAASSTFNVTAGTATQVVFTQEPGGGTGGVAWTTQPLVAIRDTFGNTATTSSASVTLTVTPGTGTTGAALTCTANPKAATSGVATFAGCKIDLAGTGYTLAATATGLTSDVSTAFDVGVGPAAKITYTQQPTTIVAGSTITPAVVAAIQDAGGNAVTSSSATVAVAITTNPGGGTLSGTVSKAASNGVVTFSDLSIDKTGVGYKLTLTSTGLTSAVSGTFNVNVGAPAKLGFTQQPSGAAAGIVWGTQPKVTIQDAFGNTVTTSSASVTLTITPGTGTSGAVLTCTANPKAATSGVVTFAGCKINLAGNGYTVTASSAGMTNGVSNAFSIT